MDCPITYFLRYDSINMKETHRCSEGQPVKYIQTLIKGCQRGSVEHTTKGSLLTVLIGGQL